MKQNFAVITSTVCELLKAHIAIYFSLFTYGNNVIISLLFFESVSCWHLHHLQVTLTAL